MQRQAVSQVKIKMTRAQLYEEDPPIKLSQIFGDGNKGPLRLKLGYTKTSDIDWLPIKKIEYSVRES